MSLHTFPRAELGESLADVGSLHRKPFALKQTERPLPTPGHPCKVPPPKSTWSCVVSAFLQNLPFLPFPGPEKPVITARGQSIKISL